MVLFVSLERNKLIFELYDSIFCYKYKFIYISNLYNVESMLFNCSSLLSIDLSFINNAIIRNMSKLLGEWKSLHLIDFSNIHLLSTSSLDMSNMLSNCITLTKENLSNYIQKIVIHLWFIFNVKL